MIAADLVEIEFKGSRKEIFSNTDALPLRIGDFVVVKAEKGTDLGQVHQVGRLVQMKETSDELKKILRIADASEIERIEEIRQREDQASIICKQKIAAYGLHMKLVDVEMQFDSNKITFFFTSEKRVDFRELVKDLATKFKTRIDLRQIGVRDEARRITGCGNCGRPLCCSTFIKEFEPITTQYAKDQNLPLNPGKLSGACGRLMCCLSYEREYYQDTLKKFPTLDTFYETRQFKGQVIKLDVFGEELTFRTNHDEYIQMPLDEFNAGLSNKEINMINLESYRNRN
jgi:cell fate regulator YaaT (PSP1 superfamily)